MTPTELSPTYTHRFLLTAAEVDAQRRMPLSRLVTTIIDVATAHANRIGIGFDHLIKHDLSWVLSRLAIDIDRMPEVNHTYLFHTWVESVNRMFSERCFEMVDADSGERVLTAHSVWMVIGMASRRPGDILSVWSHPELVSDRPYPGSKCGKLLPPAAAERESSYTFAVSDIDVNRHVTTRRYIDLFVDLWSLLFLDFHFLVLQQKPWHLHRLKKLLHLLFLLS